MAINKNKYFSKNLIDDEEINPGSIINSLNLDLDYLDGKLIHVYLKTSSKKITNITIEINQSFDNITYYPENNITIFKEDHKHIIFKDVSKFINFKVQNNSSSVISMSLDVAIFP